MIPSPKYLGPASSLILFPRSPSCHGIQNLVGTEMLLGSNSFRGRRVLNTNSGMKGESPQIHCSSTFLLTPKLTMAIPLISLNVTIGMSRKYAIFEKQVVPGSIWKELEQEKSPAMMNGMSLQKVKAGRRQIGAGMWECRRLFHESKMTPSGSIISW